MNPLALRFVSSSAQKTAEVTRILSRAGIEVTQANIRIAELQFDKIEDLVRHKTLSAFRAIRRPLFVEHTALYLDRLNGFPGGQTQHFWDCLKGDLFCHMFGQDGNTGVTAKSVVGYCDGRKIFIFEGSIKGVVAKIASTNNSFNWDSVFIPVEPKVYTKPYADLGDEKHEISMRRVALEKLAVHLNRGIA